MKLVRKHRRLILVLFSLFALGSIAYGSLRRVGCDPLARVAAPEDAEQP